MESEKLAIAKQFILPRALENHGLAPEHLEVSEAAVGQIIRQYTREAGVRNLEREISRLCRKAVRKLETTPSLISLRIEKADLDSYLGVSKFREEKLDHLDEIGIATGLAWTAVGGEVLQIEVSSVRGKGNVQITGQLGDVMQESAKAALTYIRSRADEFGLPEDYFSTHDIHVHVPEGGIPKDGPSAGITMTMSILSAVTKRPAVRSVGMTGEITLRGRVLPIGGLKEKILAAKRSGLRAVLYPIENQRDLKEIEPDLYSGLDLVPVFHTDEVIPYVLPQLRLGETAISLQHPDKSARSASAREVPPTAQITISH